MSDGAAHGFSKIVHMQDGHGVLDRTAVLTSRDANNGASLPLTDATILGLMDLLESCGLGTRLTVIWDGNARSATVYPEGVSNDVNHVRFTVPESTEELTQDDICEVLDIAYNDNLKNPSGHTAHLWVNNKLVATAEDEIERHLKGQIAMYFAGRSRPVKVLTETNNTAGRSDLLLIEKPPGQRPQLAGVIELKVLRGPLSADLNVVIEGLGQAYWYRNELHVPFATLALYDVAHNPSSDVSTLEGGLDSSQQAVVRIRRFAIYNSPQAWRTAQIGSAA